MVVGASVLGHMVRQTCVSACQAIREAKRREFGKVKRNLTTGGGMRSEKGELSNLCHAFHIRHSLIGLIAR